MKITNLPIEIQKVVFERQEEQGNAGKFKENLSAGKIVGNFNWIETPERHSFWNKIDGGNFDDFYKKYPKKDNKQEQDNFVKKVDAPKEVLLGRDSLGNTGVQQFSIGDEVELLETVAFTDLIVGMKGYVKYVSSDGRGFVDVMINGSLYTIFNKRLKLINNSNSNNYGKVHSNSTTNDICTAFVPDIRSKEISTGQVFSEFDLPHIWSGH